MRLQNHNQNLLNSMDAKYILTGGEDDLVQVWSMEDRKVVAWGEGHNSWVSALFIYSKHYIYIFNHSTELGCATCSYRLAECLLIHIGHHLLQMMTLKLLCIDLDLLVRY